MVVSAGSFSTLGRLLRQWRRVRGLSQLDLALAAGISSRHLSFVETGRAQPGRDVVLRLASALDLPLRDRNAALLAAGYAQIYSQASLQAPELEPVARALDFILRQQEPFPAMVCDRTGNVVKVNRATDRFLRLFLGEETLERARSGGAMNIYRLVLDPQLLRPYIANWEEVARFALLRLRREVASGPSRVDAPALLDDLLRLPGLPDDGRPEASAPPIVPTQFAKEGRLLSLFYTISSLGTPQDVTLQELRIECSFPADAETETYFRALAAVAPEPRAACGLAEPCPPERPRDEPARPDVRPPAA